jgi:hypothetical protein
MALRWLASSPEVERRVKSAGIDLDVERPRWRA